MTNDNPLFRHGKLSYMQIPATDVMASSAFYEAVFGWTLRGDERHRSFDDTSGELIGAWNPDLGISREPGILPYIYVEGVGATLDKVKENGGEVVRDPYPEGDLWVATFRDPAGNVLGVWQSGGR
jgi:predicted enzyme related to lactoylglutathione lyase